MKKYWTIQYKNEDGNAKFAKVISDSIVTAINWVCREKNIASEAIIYMSAEEAPEA